MYLHSPVHERAGLLYCNEISCFKIKKNFILQLFKFLILVITNIALVNGVILSSLGPYVDTPIIVYVIGVIPIFLLNFAAQRYVIFKK